MPSEDLFENLFESDIPDRYQAFEEEGDSISLQDYNRNEDKIALYSKQRKLAALRSIYLTDKEEGAKALQAEYPEMDYLTYPRAQENKERFERLMGHYYATAFAGGDVWGAIESSLLDLPEEQRGEFVNRRASCKLATEAMQVLSGIQRRIAENWFDQKEAEKKEAENLPKDIQKELPRYIMGGELSPELVGKLDKWKALEQLKPSLERGRAAFAAISEMQHGGDKGTYEAKVLAEVKRLKEEYYGSAHFMPEEKTDEDFIQQARANVGESYEITRKQILGIADILSDENGNLDEGAVAGLMMALNEDAEGQQTIDPKFVRNTIAGLKRWAAESIDYAARHPFAVAYQGDTSFDINMRPGSLIVPVKNFKQSQEYDDPRVEVLKSYFSKLEDTRLSASDKASLWSGITTSLGSIVGENVPFLASASMGGWAGLAAGAAAMFPSIANRQISEAYERGEAHPELVGNIIGLAQTGAEEMFGLTPGGNKFVGKLFDRLASKSVSLPVAGKMLGRVQGNSFLRFAFGVGTESAGELFVEDLAADSVNYMTLNGLRQLGADINEYEFSSLSERWKNFIDDPRQSAATVAYCGIMGVFGVGGTMQQARQFASRIDVLQAAGLTEKSARKLATMAGSETVSYSELTTEAQKLYQQDVLEADPVELKKRLEENGMQFMKDVEVSALARDGVRDYVLREAGIVAKEENADGTYKVTRTIKDEKGEEKQIESNWNEDQLNAYVAMRSEDMTVKAMRELQARVRGQALAEAASEASVKKDIYSLKELPAHALAELKSNGGKINYRVLESLANDASKTVEGLVDSGMTRAEAIKQESAVPNVSLGTLMKAADAFASRVQRSINTEEGKSLGISSLEEAETSIFRLNAMSPGQSVLLYNEGIVNEREIVEDLIERDLVSAITTPADTEKLGALLREVQKSLRSYDKNISLVPEGQLDAQDVIEGFSKLAQSHFLLNHNRYRMPQEAHDGIDFVQKKLADAQHLVTLSNAWDAFAKSEAGKKFIEKNGASLEKLLEDTGASVAGVYSAARATAETFERVRQAYELSSEMFVAEETIEEYNEEQKELAEHPVEPDIPAPIPAEDSITGEEVSSEDQIDTFFDKDTGELPEISGVAEGERGSGLIGERYIEATDGSIYGVAEVDNIHLSPDVPQFKKKESAAGRVQADEDGTTHALSGGWNAKTDAITVWRRKNGRLEVISGRHRLAHARKNNVKHIAVRVYDETIEHNADWAKLYDVEANILANTCNAIDIAYFFRKKPMPLAEAEQRGLLPKTKAGEQAAASVMGLEIAHKASEDSFSALINGVHSAEDVFRAVKITESPEGQALALKERREGESNWDYITALVRGAEQLGDGSSNMFDLFGFDNEFEENARKIAKYVAGVRDYIKNTIGIHKNAKKILNRKEEGKKEGIKVTARKDSEQRTLSLVLLDAAYERLDKSLNIAEKAKSSEKVDYAALIEEDLKTIDLGASFSLKKESILDRVNLREKAREESIARLARRVRKSADIWRRIFAKDDSSAAQLAQSLGEISAITEASLLLLPQNLRPNFEERLRLVEAYARLIEKGKGFPFWSTFRKRAEKKGWRIKDVTEAKLQVLEKARRDAKEKPELLGGAKSALREKFIREISEGRMSEVAVSMVEDVVSAVEKYEQKKNIDNVDKLINSLQPKKQKNGKLARGKTSAEVYKEAMRLYTMMKASAEERAARINAIAEEKQREESAPEVNEEQVERLTDELKEVVLFLGAENADLATLRKAAQNLKDFVKRGKMQWREQIDLEKKRMQHIAHEATRGLGGASAEKAKRAVEAGNRLFGTGKDFLDSFQSLSHMFYGLSGVKGLGGFASWSLDTLAQGNNTLFVRENQYAEKERDFMARELGLDTAAKRADFLADMQKNVDTKIYRAGRIVSHKLKLPVEEARRIVNMSEDELAKRNEDIKNEAERLGIDAEGIVYNDDLPLIREKLKEEANKGKKKFIQTNRKWRAKQGEESLFLSKNQALNVILLCEQPDYAEAADHNGYTAKVVQALRDFVGEKVLAYGYFMRAALDSSGLAEVFAAREGIPFPKVVNYWPGRFDQSSRINESASALDKNVGTGTAYDILITRVKHKLEFDLTIGATHSFKAAMAQQNNYIVMGELTAKWRKLLADKDFSMALKTHMGDSNFKNFKALLNLVDGLGTQMANIEHKISKIIGMAQNAHATAVLSGALTTIIKQVSAVVNAAVWGDVRLREFFPSLIMPGKASFKEINNLESIKIRDESVEEYERLQTLGVNAKWSRLAGLNRLGMKIISWVDVASNVIGMRALYNARWRQLEKANKRAVVKLNESEMKKECERVVRNALELGAQPLRQTQKSACLALSRSASMRLLGYMGSEHFQKVGAAVATYNRHGILKAMKYIVTLSSSIQAGMMLVQLLRGDVTSGTDDDNWTSWLLTNIFTGLLGGGLLQGVPVVGEIVSAITGDYVKTGTYAEQIYDFGGAKRTIIKMFNGFTGEKSISSAEWAWLFVQFFRHASAFTGFGGGVNSAGIGELGRCSSLLAEGAGALQSIETVGNFARPFVQRARVREKEEAKKQKKRKVPYSF